MGTAEQRTNGERLRSGCDVLPENGASSLVRSPGPPGRREDSRGRADLPRSRRLPSCNKPVQARRSASCAASTGITETTFYRWRAKYDGLQVSDAKRFRALEDENRRLKKLVADLSLDNAMLKDVVGRKW